MSNVQTEQTASHKPRSQRLSPELNEFLHMLSALETQLSGETTPARPQR